MPASWLAQSNTWEFNAGDQLGLARCFERFANYPLWCLTQYNLWLVMLDPMASSHAYKTILKNHGRQRRRHACHVPGS